MTLPFGREILFEMKKTLTYLKEVQIVNGRCMASMLLLEVLAAAKFEEELISMFLAVYVTQDSFSCTHIR